MLAGQCPRPLKKAPCSLNDVYLNQRHIKSASEQTYELTYHQHLYRFLYLPIPPTQTKHTNLEKQHHLRLCHHRHSVLCPPNTLERDSPMTINHYPKGSQCQTCANRFNDCSHLPFSTMSVIKSIGNDRLVKCTARQSLSPIYQNTRPEQICSQINATRPAMPTSKRQQLT